MKAIFKTITLALAGGALYYLFEFIFKAFTGGHRHWSMIIVGGLCFLYCGQINKLFGWDMPLRLQMLLCAAGITAIELLAGYILNIKLDLGVWDYSGQPFNFAGQICLSFTAIWYFLSLPAIVLDDYLRYWWYGEEKPRYRW